MTFSVIDPTVYTNNANKPTDGAKLLADLNNVISGLNTHDTEINTIMTGAPTLSGDITFSGSLTFSGMNTHTGQENFAQPGDPGSPNNGDFWYNSGSNLLKSQINGVTRTIATTAFIPPSSRGHLWGLTLSNDGTTPNTDIDIASGQCIDDTNSDLMVYAGGVKRLSATWVVGSGNGSGDTGTIPTSGTTHVYVIKRIDTGVVDIFTSTSLTPTLPSGYTLKRRIASIPSNSSAHVYGFVQYGDRFEYTTVPALDVNVTNQTTSQIIRTLTVPTGIQVEALMNVIIENGSAAQLGVYLQNLDTVNTAPSLSVSPLVTFISENNSATSDFGGGPARIRTNTSGQIGTRSTSNGTTLQIATIGWVDDRGRSY